MDSSDAVVEFVRSTDLLVVRTFAIYVDSRIAGFTMFAFDEDYENPNDRYWLWRFMIDKVVYLKSGYAVRHVKHMLYRAFY